MSKRFVGLMLILLLSSLALSNEKDGQFLLPDLFITAKDERILDSSNKIEPSLRSGLKAQDNMVDGSLQKDMGFVDKVKLTDTLSNVMYNDVSFFLGLPEMFHLKFNHGYVLYDMPYFVMFSKYDNKSLYGVVNNGGSFFLALKPDKENNFSFISKQKQLDASNLDILGIGYKRTGDFLLSYSGLMLNANAYVVNPKLTMIQHDINLDLGKVNFVGKEMESDVSLMYLGSNANKLFFIDFGLNKVIVDTNNTLDLGIQLWSNAGIQKFNLLVDHKSRFNFADLAFITKFQMIHEPLTIGRFFSADFVEMDDAVIRCDERFTIGVSINGILKDQKETFFADLNYYNYLNLLDDSLADDYYSFTGFTDLTVLNVGVFFPEVKIASESVNVKLQIPIVSKVVPNLFNKILEVGYEKDVFSGKFTTKGSVYLRELGRTTGTNHKEGYFDIDASYEQALSSDWSFGLYLENLLSAGNAYLPDRNFRDTVLYGKIKVVF